MVSISVVINNFNYARYLRTCIDSALNQNRSPKEVIVVDDGSSDGSQEIIKSYGSRIVPILQTNGGQAAAINAGFARANGSLVLFLDSDDFLAPEAVEVVLAEWEDNLAKLHYPLTLVNQGGSPIGRMPNPGQKLAEGELLNELLTNGTYHWMPTSANVYSTSMLQTIMPIPPDRFRISADLYLSICCARFGRIKALNRVLGFYRIHGENHYQSNQLFAASDRTLRSRINSHIARAFAMEREAQLSSYETPLLPLIYYTTLYGWMDLTIGSKLLGISSISPFTEKMLEVGPSQRIALRYGSSSRSPSVAAIKLAFAFVRILRPTALRWVLKLINRIERPVLQPLARCLVRDQK